MRCDTIACYIRLSVEDGDLDGENKRESNSIVHQRMILNEFVQSRPDLREYRILEFCDDGFSGTNFERPAFQKMMTMVKLKQISCIIVKDLSRFGREYLEVSSYLELILPVFDIRFISVNDYFDSNDYIGTTGGMELAFRNLINGMYSRDISVKVKTARKTRERKGEYIGGHPFYGYLKDPSDRHHLLVDEEVRPIIQDIFQMSAEGYSTTEIARELNKRGVLCPVEHKKRRGVAYSKKLTEDKALWIQCTVRKIIRDERYLGKMVSNVRSCPVIGKNTVSNNEKSEWIIVDGTHEPIVSEELFHAANEALMSRNKAVNKNTSWKNSGNLFVCGYCGRKLQSSKGREPYLYCLKSRYAEEEECERVHESLEQVKYSVLAIIKAMGQAMSDGAVIRHRESRLTIAQLEKEADSLKTRIQKHKTEKRFLYENYRAGHMTKEEFIQVQERHQRDLEVLERKFREKALEADQKKKEQEAAAQVQEELRTASVLTEYDPKIIGKIVEQIVVYGGGHVELIMRSQDSYEAVFQSKTALSA